MTSSQPTPNDSLFDLRNPATPETLWAGICVLNEKMSHIEEMHTILTGLVERVAKLERTSLDDAHFSHVKVSREHAVARKRHQEEVAIHVTKTVAGYVALIAFFVVAAVFGVSHYLEPLTHASGH
jgi:hypothetical protein